MQLQQQQNFIVAPVMSDQKEKQFKYNILQTITGIHQDNISLHRLEELFILFPVTLIVPLVVGNKAAAIIVPTVINVLLNFIEDIVRSEPLKIGTVIVRNIFLGIYTFLWASHLYFLIQFNNTQIYNIIFSAISIFTSIYTIARIPVKQFSANGFENTQIGWNSTLYMRFFIVFPTLFAQFIIFNSSDRSGVSPDNAYLFPLRLINSLIFITWWFGWISSIKTTFTFIVNKFGVVVLGNQTQSTFRYALMDVIQSMIPIAVYMVINSRNGNMPLNSFIIGSVATSLGSFIRYRCAYTSISKGCSRTVFFIIFQIVFCIILAVIYQSARLTSANLTVFLVINAVLYVIFSMVKELFKGWSYFGFTINVRCIRINYVNALQRIVLRITSALCFLIIMNNYSNEFLSLFPYNSGLVAKAIYPFLGFRSFKRCITHTTTFSLHFSLLLCLILINSGMVAEGTLIALIMPPFPNWIWSAFTSIFTIPPKLIHKNQCCYQVGYFFLTLLGLVVYFGTLGLFELTMIFGLPIYAPGIPTQTSGFEVKSAQNSLYEKIVQKVDKTIFSHYDNGYYLLRIQKYILLLEIKSTCFGFAEIMDIRGLQVQEVTSCHSKEGETIDKLVQQVWGDNKKCCSLMPYEYLLTPYVMEKVNVPTQNQIQLTGIIQSNQFVKLFKDTALKAIIWELSKMELSQNQISQGQVMVYQLSAFFKKDQAEQVFPFDFAKKCRFPVNYPVVTSKTKLPPLKEVKGKKPELVNDFMDLLETSNNNEKIETSNYNLTEVEKSNIENPSKISKETKEKSIKTDEINMAIALTFYYYSIGKQDYLNTSKLYRMIKRQTDTVTQIEFDSFVKTISLAVGSAFKISIDKYIEGDFETSYEDFQQYEKSSFLGTSDSDQFKQAILRDKQHIWSISYVKRALAINRMAHSETNMYIFKVDETILKSVWNNLRFELIYATNNNDERYSIQTHPNLMRNLWVEACEEPFGYPSYHSGPLLNT